MLNNDTSAVETVTPRSKVSFSSPKTACAAWNSHEIRIKHPSAISSANVPVGTAQALAQLLLQEEERFTSNEDIFE